MLITSLPHYGPDGKHQKERRHGCAVNTHTHTLDIKGLRSVPWYSNGLRPFLCFRLKSPTCLSLPLSRSLFLSLSSTPPLRVNFQTERSDEEEGRRIRMKAVGGWEPEGNANVDDDDEEEEAATGKPVRA